MFLKGIELHHGNGGEDQTLHGCPPTLPRGRQGGAELLEETMQ